MVAPRVDVLLTLKDYIASYSVLVAGEFKDEIATLSQLKKDVDAQASLVDTKEKLDAYKAEADAYYSKRFDEAEALVESQKVAQEQFRVKSSQLDTTITENQQTSKALYAQKLEQDAEVFNRMAALDTRDKALTTAEESVRSKFEDIAAQQVALDKANVDLQRKLAVIKSIE